eukprot:770018-Pelagomonas_calceolata.AAC.1
MEGTHSSSEPMLCGTSRSLLPISMLAKHAPQGPSGLMTKLAITFWPGAGHNGLVELLKRVAYFWLQRVPERRRRMVRAS